MADEGYKRKLTTIFSTDAVGYSRLMGDDEAATVHTIELYRKIISDLIVQSRGRVIDSPGDNLLAEFSSVVDAVQCAVAIQKELQSRNAELPESRKMRFRIGINLGDVIEEEDRIYGDGVNIAARLEALADPGGICISKTAFDHIESKLPLGYECLGDQTVKNIPKPVCTYRVLMEPRVTVAETPDSKKPTAEKRKPIIVGVAAVIVLAVTMGIWYFFIRPIAPHPHIETASVDKMAFPLPDKPSIAVLPFVNMSDDPEQEYFSDGMTEDLITDLSKISDLFVVGRNSTFAYKGKTIMIRQVAEDLGVRYILEGSVRKAGKRVRVNSQLTDATTGQNLWAERYDGKLDDIFDLQDKINQKIMSALKINLTVGEQEQLARKETDNVDVYDNFLQGLEHYRRNTPDDWAKAVPYLKAAIKLDPNYGRAYALLAHIYDHAAVEYLFGLVSSAQWASALGVSYQEAQELADKYLQLAKNNPTSLYHWLASRISLENHWHEAAIAEAELALDFEPNNPDILVQMAKILVYAAKPEEALKYANKAMRMDPNYSNPDYFWSSGMAYFTMEKLEEALALFEEAHKRNSQDRWYAFPVAVTYAHLGRKQEARKAITESTAGFYRPMTVATLMLYMPFKDKETAYRFADGLRKAGMK